MATKPKLKTFQVGVCIHIWLDVEVKEVSIGEALNKADTLKITDLLGKNMPACNDYSIKIVQVHDPNFEI